MQVASTDSENFVFFCNLPSFLAKMPFFRHTGTMTERPLNALPPAPTATHEQNAVRPGVQAQQQKRKDKLAAALRANLRRRKAPSATTESGEQDA
jgi:hypothetical protein